MEDVAAGDTDDALDVRRAEHLEMLDSVRNIRREHGKRIDDIGANRGSLVVPRAVGEIIRRVLHEEAHGVLARRGEIRLSRGLDVAIHERAAAGMAALAVVPGGLEVIDRGVDNDAAGVLRADSGPRHGGEVGELTEGH